MFKYITVGHFYTRMINTKKVIITNEVLELQRLKFGGATHKKKTYKIRQQDFRIH